MRKRLYFIALSAIILSACTGTKEHVEVGGTPMVLTAYQEIVPESKTAVENGGKQVFWEPGDEIKVFSGSRTGRFTSNATGLTAVTEFSGLLEGTDPDVEDIWAVYPYSDAASFDGESITTVIPSVQTARPGTFAQGANVAIAHSATTSLQFYNVGGGIRFSITEEGIRRIIFEGLDGETISGTIRVALEDGQPKVKEVTGGSMFITLLPPEGDCFSVNTWYYITAVPGALDAGFKLRFYKDDDTYAKLMYEKAVSIKRKVFLSLANADYGIDFNDIAIGFPSTLEEFTESVSMTDDISEALNDIVSSGDEIDDNTIQDIKSIDGVIEVETSEDKSVISILQRDSVWINYLLNTQDSYNSFNEDNVNFLSSQTIKRQLSRSSNKSSSKQSALIYAPFQIDFQKPIVTWENCLKYFYPSVTVLKRDDLINNAGILELRDALSKDYDFILIDTHGDTGKSYRATNMDIVEGIFGQKCTQFATSTLYTADNINNLINNEGIAPEALAVFKVENEYYIGITPDFLPKRNYDNSCVVLSACLSAELDHEDSMERSMIGAFKSRGVSLVSGAKVSMSARALGEYINLLLQLMEYGLSYQRAHEYLTNNALFKEWLDFCYNDSGKNSFDSFNIPKHFKSFDFNNQPFFFFDCKPILNNEVQRKQDVYLLEWSCPLEAFKVYFANRVEDKKIIRKEISYDVKYDVYVDNARLGKSFFADDSDKQASCSVPAGNHTWYVVAKIMENGSVLVSYQSEVGHFTVEDSPNIQDYPTPEAVDLGLSVKWASFNLGASKPEEYGDYFGWGDIETKKYYNWTTCRFRVYDGTAKLIKYCPSDKTDKWGGSGLPDNKTVLDPEDDAAHVNLGGSWRMPTYEEWNELLANCTWTWTTNYNGTGIAGRLLTSGNGNSIFLPAAGDMEDTGLYGDGSSGCFWSSSLNTDSPFYAWMFSFYTDGVFKGISVGRYVGYSIRPVTD